MSSRPEIINLSDCHNWYVYVGEKDNKRHCYKCKKVCTWHKGLEPHGEDKDV